MGLEQWDCGVCGWRWSVADQDWGIEAFGAHVGQRQLVILNITLWAADEPVLQLQPSLDVGL